ncbi:translation initiation factor IF-5A [uncultured Methanobrevibacter sp.]|uniref:translation initiation factor IF-5A n=1 Tax=uncultured Methanobrevibacter sp. TaxID=253161 RepID=UPI00260C354B
MSTKVVELKTVKVGKYIVLDGEASKVTSLTTSSPGKHGAAKARLEAVGIFDGQKRSLVKPVDTKVEVPILDKRIGQILAIMGDQVQIMDLESYETFELPIPAEFDEEIRNAVGTDLGVEYIIALGNMKIMRTKKV